MHRFFRTVGLSVLFAGVLVYWFIYQDANPVDATIGKKAKTTSVRGRVTDSRNRLVSGATVYFIDANSIDTTDIRPADILSGKSEAYDEPLEDIINNPAKEKDLPKAVSDKNGRFTVRGLDVNARYFPFVVPANTDYLPGGDMSRRSFAPRAFPKGGLVIKLTWNTPADATYIGSSACYTCHPEIAGAKQHGHALAFRKPGQVTANQSLESHPGHDDLSNKFTLATAYNAPVSGSTVKTLYFQDFNSNSATNQGNVFVIYEDTPGTSPVWLKMYLWKTPANEYKVTLENVIDPADPNNFLTLDVPLLIGGYLRQRLAVSVPGRRALYQFITYQAIRGTASQGSMANYDRSRKPFLMSGTGGGGLTLFFNTTTRKLAPAPALSANNIARCGACHVGAGPFQTFVHPTTGETVSRTVPDPNGLWDLDGDGNLDELGIGCEQCHGPGSRHREEALKGLTQDTSKRLKPADDTRGKFIVNPQMLGADRASLICGRCHAEVNHISTNNFAPVGISRAEFLNTYVSNKGSPLTRFWPDGSHELGGHRGTAYSDWLESKHMRNSRQLVACDDCHDMGGGPYRYALKGDPDSSTQGLCSQCHALDVNEHVVEQTGSLMMGHGMKCIDCHMPRTGKGGAGRPGLILGTPTGTIADANIMYWQNDQASHSWHVPFKFTRGVAGVTPGSAMPVPYTNSCAPCHDASKLQFQAPLQ